MRGATRSKLGAAIQRRRLELNQTLRELAELLAVAPSTVSRIERGEMGPGDAAGGLANWLGWTPEQVVKAAKKTRRVRVSTRALR